MKSDSTVFIVDDDADVRQSLIRLMEEVKQPVQAFGNAGSFLEAYDPAKAGCLVLDVRMPGMSGIELHRKLTAEGITIPVILVTGHGDITMAVESMQRGAVDFMEKPIKPQVFLDRVQQALARDADNRRAATERDEITARFALLSPREHEVVKLAASGLTNKRIAANLGVRPQAIDARRSKAMDKLHADSVAELVHLAHKAGIL